jgi:hypothetical protein
VQIFAGVAADVWGLSVLAIDGAAAAVAAVSLAGWAVYFWGVPRHRDHAYRNHPPADPSHGRRQEGAELSSVAG